MPFALIGRLGKENMVDITKLKTSKKVAKEKVATEISDKLGDWLKNNKVIKLKPGKAKGAKDPGLACSWNDKNMKPGTSEQIEARKKSAAIWKQKKREWKRLVKRRQTKT